MITFGEELYNRLGPLTDKDADHGYALQKFTDACGAMFDQIELYARDQDDGTPGWTNLVDPDLSPDLDSLYWLSQLAGVSLTQGLDYATAQSRIKQAENRRRGTVAYMVEVAQRYLTGTKTVFVKERDLGAYHAAFVTRTLETPDTAAVLAALKSVKPAAIQLSYNAITGYTWTEATSTWDASGLTWEETLTTHP